MDEHPRPVSPKPGETRTGQPVGNSWCERAGQPPITTVPSYIEPAPLAHALKTPDVLLEQPIGDGPSQHVGQLCLHLIERRIIGFCRAFGLNRICPEPRIRITRAHLENVLRKRRNKQISDRDLIDWATMLTINNVFYWDWNDQALADWINRLTLDFLPEDS